MESPKQIVFVYGTLRRGGSNHFHLVGAEFVAAGTVMGRLYRIDWYPGLVLDTAGSEIRGEVYAVDSEQLSALDAFEGLSAGEIEGSEYRRIQTSVMLQNSQTITAWVWEWLGNVDESLRIADGDWLRDD